MSKDLRQARAVAGLTRFIICFVDDTTLGRQPLLQVEFRRSDHRLRNLSRDFATVMCFDPNVGHLALFFQHQRRDFGERLNGQHRFATAIREESAANSVQRVLNTHFGDDGVEDLPTGECAVNH